MYYIMNITWMDDGFSVSVQAKEVAVRLYINPISPNSRKVRAVARHVGVDVEEVVVDRKAGEQRTDAFLAKSPNGMVPLLEDGGGFLFESNAIAVQLADRPGSPLALTESSWRAQTLQWLAWEGCHLAPPVLDLAFERAIKPMLGPADPDPATVERSLAGYARFGAVLDRQLAGHTFLLGEAVGVADFCLAACFTFADASGLPLSDTPQVQRWLRALDEVPAWRDTAPPGMASRQ